MAFLKSGLKACLAFLLPALVFCGCSRDDVESVYSRHKAFFCYDKVTTVQPLYAALTGGGMFCGVYLQGGNIVFSSLDNTVQAPLTAVAYYQRYNAISGFIVGMANVPEVGNVVLPVLCYDRVCPNCYESNSVSRPLSLQDGGFAYCSRCKRRYDLNNMGLVVDGEKGIKLFRYHIAYNGSNLVQVSN